MTKKKAPDNGHGGVRPGAGRKPLTAEEQEQKRLRRAKAARDRRAAAKAAAGEAPATAKLTLPAEAKAAPMGAWGDPKAMIHLAAMLAAKGKAKEVRRNPFMQLPRPPPGVVPKGAKRMAMDQGVNWAATQWDALGPLFGSVASEGLQFLGYPYLSELAQRTEYRQISETIADDATRKWIDFEVTGEKEREEKESAERDRQSEERKAGIGETPKVLGQDLSPEPWKPDEEEGQKAENPDGNPALRGRGFTDNDPEKRQDKIKAAGKMDKVKALKDELIRLGLRDAMYAICRDDGFFGRTHLLLKFGKHDKLEDDEELKKPIGDGRDALSKGKVGKDNPLRAVKTIEPVWTYPTFYNAVDPTADDWYAPQNWYVMGRQINVTRLLPFIGHPVPDLLKPAYSFGGISLSQLVQPYVDIWLTTRTSVGTLIHAFSVMCLGTDVQTILAPGATGGPGALMARVDAFNAFRDNMGTFIYNKNTEDFKNVSAPLGGLHELVAQTQEHVMSAARIPDIKYTGINPSGLNASTDGTMRAYYDTIAGYQNRFERPNLTKVINFVQLSLWGEIDEEITFEFEPLWEMSEKEKSDLQKSQAERDTSYVTMGALAPEEVRKNIIDDPSMPYSDLDPDDVPELKQEEEQGLVPEGAGKGLEAVLGDPNQQGGAQQTPPGALPGGAGGGGGAGPAPGGPGGQKPGHGDPAFQEDEALDDAEAAAPRGLPWADRYEWMRGFDIPATDYGGNQIMPTARGEAARKGLRIGSRVRYSISRGPSGTGRAVGFTSNAEKGDRVAILDSERDRFLCAPIESVSTRPVVAEEETQAHDEGEARRRNDATVLPFSGDAADLDPLFADLAGDAFEWEESKHPRDPKGEFTAGASAGAASHAAQTGAAAPTKGYGWHGGPSQHFVMPQFGLSAPPYAGEGHHWKPEPRPPLDPSKLKKVGPQMGSNPGGVFEDDKGRKFYVKQGQSKDHVRNELTAADLYDLAGAPTARYRDVVGGKHIASEMEKLSKKNASEMSDDDVRKAKRDFATHAWTANYDAVGTGGDNLVKAGGDVFSIDLGGALEYRARGKPKGDAFGNQVTELDTMRDPKVAPDASAIFGGITPAEFRESAARVTRIKDDAIWAAVKARGGSDALADKMIARKNDIAKRARTFGAEGKPEKKTSTVIFPAGDALPVKTLNGVAFKAWEPPKDGDWNEVDGQMDIEADEPLPEHAAGKQLASGVVIREKDGRVWLVQPKGAFGGYSSTFPKGRVEPTLSLQANAIKEAWEESGLKVRIAGLAGDRVGDTTLTRYYLAEREGGDPSQTGDETEGVVLAPPGKLAGFLNRERDQKLAKEVVGDEWSEADHPRGQPGNAGEFGPGGGGSSGKPDKWAASGGKVRGTPDGMYKAYDKKGRLAGALIVDVHQKPKEVFNVNVKEPFRRQGVATALYRAAEKDHGELSTSGALSDLGFAFRKGYRPESVKNDLRIHSDKLIGQPVKSTYGEGKITSLGPRAAIATTNGAESTWPVPKAELQRLIGSDEVPFGEDAIDTRAAERATAMEAALDEAFDEEPGAPRTLYVNRPLLNAGNLAAWARECGIKKLLPPGDMHVTVAFSKTPLAWADAGTGVSKVVAKGGARSVERLGNEGAVVLRFECPQLERDWRRICEAGASWDHPGYKPHVTFTMGDLDADLEKIEPYDGPLEFGPEEWDEIGNRPADWAAKAKASLVASDAFEEGKHPRGQPENKGQFGPGGGGAAQTAKRTSAGRPQPRRGSGAVLQSRSQGAAQAAAAQPKHDSGKLLEKSVADALAKATPEQKAAAADHDKKTKAFFASPEARKSVAAAVTAFAKKHAAAMANYHLTDAILLPGIHHVVEQAVSAIGFGSVPGLTLGATAVAAYAASQLIERYHLNLSGAKELLAPVVRGMIDVLGNVKETSARIAELEKRGLVGAEDAARDPSVLDSLILLLIEVEKLGEEQAQDEAPFEESKHPRDAHGEFTTKGNEGAGGTSNPATAGQKAAKEDDDLAAFKKAVSDIDNAEGEYASINTNTQGAEAKAKAAVQHGVLLQDFEASLTQMEKQKLLEKHGSLSDAIMAQAPSVKEGEQESFKAEIAKIDNAEGEYADLIPGLESAEAKVKVGLEYDATKDDLITHLTNIEHSALMEKYGGTKNAMEKLAGGVEEEADADKVELKSLVAKFSASPDKDTLDKIDTLLDQMENDGKIASASEGLKEAGADPEQFTKYAEGFKGGKTSEADKKTKFGGLWKTQPGNDENGNIQFNAGFWTQKPTNGGQSYRSMLAYLIKNGPGAGLDEGDVDQLKVKMIEALFKAQDKAAQLGKADDVKKLQLALAKMKASNLGIFDSGFKAFEDGKAGKPPQVYKPAAPKPAVAAPAAPPPAAPSFNKMSDLEKFVPAFAAQLKQINEQHKVSSKSSAKKKAIAAVKNGATLEALGVALKPAEKAKLEKMYGSLGAAFEKMNQWYGPESPNGKYAAQQAAVAAQKEMPTAVDPAKPTDAEIAKAKKTVALQLQYVPNAPAGSAEAQKLVDEFNAKWSGKEVSDADALKKIADFKAMAEKMKPLMSEAQKKAAEENAKLAEQAKKSQAEQAAAMKAQTAKHEAELAEYKKELGISDAEAQAFEGLASILGKDKNDLIQAFKKSGQGSYGLTAFEGSLIRSYKQSSSVVNEEMRKPEASWDAPRFMFAKVLNKALEKVPHFKGVTIRNTGLSANVQMRYKPGNVVVEHGFTGTSKKKPNGVFVGGNTRFFITGIGKRAGDIADIYGFEGEQEVLYQAHTAFHVDKVEGQVGAGGSASYKVYMTELES